ncbi:MAG: PEP-CTERM sorting domain-containing protein [Verrucomicrobiota bacterium]|nr:PEP-CTERM sorting domain-containing protein [Verrucomicrobiota bacterium]
MNKSLITLLGLALLSAGTVNAALITNPAFYNGVSGSLNGWTVNGTVNLDWNGVTDSAGIRSGSSISQVFGDAYTVNAGDTISVTFDKRNAWNASFVDATFFSDGNLTNVLFTQSFALTGGFETATITFTALDGQSYLGKSVGIALASPGVFADDKWIGVDNVNASVTPVPEASTLALMASAAALGFALLRRKRQ